ncbi:hypothetical protein ABE504_09965 [Paenibacillus oryzisoli]|uniref:hypothetical protein n=1 Tax=Paenibacillus oryzisoli TaxID=1850517 RepID=UPI003D26FC8C
MRNPSKPFVAAVAAVSGGGKTTVVRALQKKLACSQALYFDNYEFDSPEDICAWVERGANMKEWGLTPLVEDLQNVLSGKGRAVDYVFLDYPFAYLHDDMSGCIDLAVFIDTPLDVAMARRILREYKNSSIDRAITDASHYLTRGRRAYEEMLVTVKPSSDFIIDGCLPVQDIVNEVVAQIQLFR